MSRLDETIQAKKQKRHGLEQQGILVHPYTFNKTHSAAAARDSEGETVTTAGRIMSLRSHGKVTFLTVADSTGAIQVMIKADEIGSEWYARLSLIDTGDFLGVSGKVVTTTTGEITIQADSLTFLGKALRALPDSWQGIEDKEVRFRKRYLDLLVSPDVRKVLEARWTITREIRRYLQDAHQFTEVETPVLQPLYGGTNARPFTTHMNALDSDFYLRIAPELYLKRLIVGGYERIFELARNFRNEGIDQTHQPEFTMMEWYMAYADYQKIMDVAEGLLKHLADRLYGVPEITMGDVTISLAGTWPRIRMVDALKQFNKIDVTDSSDQQLEDLIRDHQLEMAGTFSRGKAIYTLFDKLTTPHLINPTWIIDYPKEVSPLAKIHRDSPDFVERFELYVGGKEIADGWSELTDPIDQRSRFENEQRRMREGDEEAQPLDEDFLEAMEYGLPPLGGIGIGIDRLVMFLTNTWSIREVIAFPTLRPTPEQLATSRSLEAKAHKKTASEKDQFGMALTHEEAWKLVTSMVKNKGLQTHMLTMELQMRALWEYFMKLRPSEVTETQDVWGLAGLLHDADWEETETHPEQHTLLLSEKLKELHVPDRFADSIRSHNAKHLENQRGPESLMEWALYGSDHMSGIIVACALVSPEKKLTNVTLERVLKKFKEKSFAKGATRAEILTGLEHLGIDLPTLAGVCLQSLQDKSHTLGL